MTYIVVSNDPVRNEAAALEYAKSYNPADVFWVKKSPDKKEITVDVISNMVNQTTLSAVGDKKLFIIFQADLMNANAQNKLLKTIENLDEHTTVLFLCENLNNILPTIKSRSIIRYHNNQENFTIKKLKAENPESTQIYQAAKQLFTDTSMDQAITTLPILTKPENLTLALDALNQALSVANFPDNKKLRLYQALAVIARNIAANCNPTNAFDLLLIELF